MKLILITYLTEPPTSNLSIQYLINTKLLILFVKNEVFEIWCVFCSDNASSLFRPASRQMLRKHVELMTATSDNTALEDCFQISK